MGIRYFTLRLRADKVPFLHRPRIPQTSNPDQPPHGDFSTGGILCHQSDHQTVDSSQVFLFRCHSDGYWRILFEDGTIAGLFGTLHDVTEEVNAAKLLCTSEARSVRVMQSIGDAVIVTDPECRITRMNPVAEFLTGWGFEEAKGRPLAQVFNIVNELSREPVENPAEK